MLYNFDDAPSNGFAIVVGHTSKRPGASGVQPINQSEYVWNSDLAKTILAECKRLKVPSRIFFRDSIGISGAYKQVAKWGASCVVELHFNAFNGTVRGTETLFDKDKNNGSEAWAQNLQNSILTALSTKDRGIKELDSGDRGYESVSALNIPSALIEPFFGDNAMDAKVAHDRKDDLAQSIAKTAKKQISTS